VALVGRVVGEARSPGGGGESLVGRAVVAVARVAAVTDLIGGLLGVQQPPGVESLAPGMGEYEALGLH
jgi:hypothetical protein